MLQSDSLNNTLTTKGAVNFQSSIDESGSSTFARVAATGAVSTNGTLGTSGAETFSDSLTVVSAVGCGCGLIVSAELKGKDALTIGGVSRIGNYLSASSSVYVDNSLSGTGLTRVGYQYSLSVVSDSILIGEITVAESVTLWRH